MISMDSSRIAALELRVGTLEADLAAAQQRIDGLTGVVESLARQVADLKARARKAY